MKKGRFICKSVVFVAVLALLLGLAAFAAAEENPCAVVHQGGWRYVVTLEPTCTETGSRDKYCMTCGQKIGTETISAIGHKPQERLEVNQAAKCTSAGSGQKITQCTVCRAIISVVDVTIPALGHDYPSDWTVTKQPTCEGTGTKQRVCRRDSSHVETETINALGHLWGDWTVTKQPTCEGTGTETRVCARDSSHKETRDKEPLGHLWGAPVTKPATCIAPATTTKICQRDSSHKDTSTSGSVDLVNGHVWGDWKVTKKPNCTEEGVETRICKLDSSHIQTRPLAVVPSAHVWDNGTVIKEPTYTEEGEKLFVCTLNPDHTKTVKLDTRPWNNNTVCAFGPRLSETNLYPYNTDAWYMFTPFDASNNGTQTFELVASNTYIVGKVTLTIRDGSLKIDYTLADNSKFDITLEFFTVLNRINDLTQYEPEQLMDLRIGQGETINLEEKFGDDTSLVLYFCSRCNYRFSKKYTLLAYNSAVHQRMLDDMRKLMD